MHWFSRSLTFSNLHIFDFRFIAIDRARVQGRDAREPRVSADLIGNLQESSFGGSRAARSGESA